MALERSDEIYFTWKAIKLGFTAGCSCSVYLKINHFLTNFDLGKALPLESSYAIIVEKKGEREVELVCDI